MDYRGQAARIARAYGLDPEIFIRQMETESGFNPQAVSPAGAGGIAQIMPATARQPGFGITPISDQDRFDPETSMNFGAQYMRAMLDRYDGDYARALAAYNAGPGRVDRAGGVPNIPETQNYVSRIMGGGGEGPTVFASSRGQGQADEPQGLLGALGLQRRDPEAGGQTAMPFYQRDNFGRLMDAVAVGFNELRMNPSQAVPALVAQRQEQRLETARANQTMEWLRTQPGSEPYVQMLEAGGSPAEVIAAYTEAQRAEAAAMREAAGQLGLSDEQLSAAGALRDDLRAELQNFGWQSVNSGFRNIMSFYENPSAVSDYALAVAFAKVLDPGSVAREGEVAAVQSAGAAIPALAQALQNAITGEGSLTPEVRQQIAERARDIYAQQAADVTALINNYTQRAQEMNIPSNFIYFGEMPGEIPDVTPQGLPSIPANVFNPDGSPLDRRGWQRLWDQMTDTERQQYNTTGQLPQRFQG